MTRSLVPVLTLAGVLAACSPSSTPGGNIEPASPNASVAGAGRGGRGGPGGGRADQTLLRGITLSADQQQRIDTIRTRYRAQLEQMRQNAGTDRDAARTQMHATMEKQQAEIRAVLTPEQQGQFDQNVADMGTRRGRGGRP